MSKTILVTGGAGFIGSAVVRYLIKNTNFTVVNVDKLTYAGNLSSLKMISQTERYLFEQIDICDEAKIKLLFDKYKPTFVMHLAAESHVDRSIDGPSEFIQTNLVGTYNMLECARQFWNTLDDKAKLAFRFHHISTDEVYGDLSTTDNAFTEKESKIRRDTPKEFFELVILNALAGKPLPVYGDGNQVRDWLFVDDHAEALYTVLTQGVIGETYNIGGHNEKRNIDVVKTICELLDEFKPPHDLAISSYSELITFVEDRPGHDLRYAIDASKIKNELGWTPRNSFDSGMKQTIEWFLNNEEWWSAILDGSYKLERRGNQNGETE